MIHISLTEEEVELVTTIAADRYSSNRQSGVKDQKIGPQSTTQTDLEGMAGELAFCKIYNLEPDFTIKPRSWTNDPGDARLAKWIFDVKTTKYRNGRLLAPSWRRPKGDVLYCLMIGSCPDYSLVGGIKAIDFLVKENLTDLGHGPTYAVNQDQLRPFKFKTIQGTED